MSIDIDSTNVRQLQNQAAKLLQRYHPSTSFFYATPKYTMLAQGPLTRLETLEGVTEREEILSLIRKEWAKPMSDYGSTSEERNHRKRRIVGAIPFDMNVQTQLYVCENVHISSSLRKEEIPYETNRGLDPAEIVMRSEPNEEQYKADVSEAVRLINRGHLDKVVLARKLHIKSSKTVQAEPILSALLRLNPEGYTFSVPLTKMKKAGNNSMSASIDLQTQSTVTLLGASPELLIRRTGMEVTANPLAGSIPRSEDPVEDQKRAQNLLISSKDLHEHELVVKAIATALRPLCRELHVPQKPSLIATETMWHLSTEMTGVLEDSSTTSLELAMAMHPTPAVCGTPTKEAKKTIDRIEAFDRDYYTGMIGWCDEEGDGEWVVTIRCAEIEENELCLYAGAGIVAGSKPEDELAETAAKLATFLQAIGLKEDKRVMTLSRGDQ
ncbi:isochorismate synthase EntC [Paenibacillus sp. J45TS6]|uniref:isochorismate synthase DhbC n=1 Tax=unclassified Paenibacillus TaxID=185978 RepID=UPI001AFD6102|nr:isochorismate synthase DhbC [Paenibacillus sp. J45TS6]GIP45428.1 isochorismate synthase EntC [Paenibacillus sp. J45TS6]